MPHPRVGLPLPPRGTRTRPSRGVIVAMRATAYGTSSSRTSARRSRLGSSRVGAGSPRSPRRLIQTERIPSAFRGHDVVKTALGDVDMAPSVRTRGLVERPPVSVGRLVRTDLRRHNRSLERNADRAKRSVDQVAIAVRQSEQSPPPALSLSQGVPDAREHRPIRQRTAQRVVLACRKRHPRLRRKSREHRVHHLAIAPPGMFSLDSRLDQVVAGQQPLTVGRAEQAIQLGGCAGRPTGWSGHAGRIEPLHLAVGRVAGCARRRDAGSVETPSVETPAPGSKDD